MNKNRRQQLKEWIQMMGSLKGKLESICSDEEMDFDAMPENLQGSPNGMNSEEAIDKMNEAIELMDEAINCIEEII